MEFEFGIRFEVIEVILIEINADVYSPNVKIIHRLFC